jgi:hypothetical protein
MKITLTITDLEPSDLAHLARALGVPTSVFSSAGAPAPAQDVRVVTVQEKTQAAVPLPATTPAAVVLPPAATSTPATAEREPGSDDDEVAKPDDAVFLRCTTVKDVVKEIVRRGTRVEAEVLAEVQRLQDAGTPVLKPVAAAMLPDKVHIILTTLGVIQE